MLRAADRSLHFVLKNLAGVFVLLLIFWVAGAILDTMSRLPAGTQPTNPEEMAALARNLLLRTWPLALVEAILGALVGTYRQLALFVSYNQFKA